MKKTIKINNLVDLLETRVKESPDFPIYRYLREGEEVTDAYTFSQFRSHSFSIATELKKSSGAGERVMLWYLPGIDFISAYYGCLYAKCIAVPLPPPRLSRLKQTLQKLLEIARSAEPTTILTSAYLRDKVNEMFDEIPQLKSYRWIATDEIDGVEIDGKVKINIKGDDLAFLQYTSGSTALPKGVMLSHQNLMHNMKYFDEGCVHGKNAKLLTWLPPFHDLGLIYGLLTPIYAKIECYIMPNASFIQKPSRWLEAISRFRITHTMGPNFAFDLCTHSISEEQIKHLDLTCLEHALNGAEPVRMNTIKQFEKRFVVAGLGKNVVAPAYGLAEASCIVTGVHYGITGNAKKYRRAATEVFLVASDLAENRVKLCKKNSVDAVSMVSSGYPIADSIVKIVDPNTFEECNSEKVGEVWINSKAVSTGYWNNPEMSKQTFQGKIKGEKGGRKYLRTGDLGFLLDNEIYITGRSKDVIIVRGQNHYPQDIEWNVDNCHALLRKGGTAAFSLTTEDEERLVVVAEVGRRFKADIHEKEIYASIRKTVTEEHQLQAAAIVLIRMGTIPKTTSGKIQRTATKKDFLKGLLETKAEWISAKLKNYVHRQREETTIVDNFNPTFTLESSKLDFGVIKQWLVDKIAAIAELEPNEIDPAKPFGEYGLDSNQSVRLTGELAAAFNLANISPSIAYDYPTISDLSQHIVGVIGAGDVLVNDENSNSKNTKEDLENILVVGMDCVFPGAQDIDSFRNLIFNGETGISAPSESRLKLLGPSVQASKLGNAGYINSIDLFDSAFFNISPREAEQLDPQQRLLLMSVWRALEDAQITKEELYGTDTGVFIGQSSNDYSHLVLRENAQFDGHAGPGVSNSIAANRISYFLNLRGPSMVVDTACSSSLVALHLAIQSIRSGECSTAIVGGVNLLLNHLLTDVFRKAGMLSKSDRCHTFDNDADGYVRGEGVGVILLRKQASAVSNPHHAVILGSAINQDGKSFGLTAPNGESQQRVIRGALADAGVSPCELQYVEAHGTGTALGDPIEYGALASVVKEGRQGNDACFVGSVKANIGHLEAAAGIAGIIKSVLCLKYNAIPGLAGFAKLNKKIDACRSALEINNTVIDFSSSNPLRRIGVTSMGFGGTNAHVILGRVETGIEDCPEYNRDSYIFPISADHPTTLKRLASRYIGLFEKERECWPSLCRGSATGRSILRYRHAFSVDSPQSAIRKLNAIEEDLCTANNKSGYQTKVAFMFSGQGVQYPRMGKQLYDTCPAYKNAINEIDSILTRHGICSISESLYSDDAYDQIKLNETINAQIAIFSVEYALAKYLDSVGIVPSLMFGHSLGEYVAACVGGALTLEDAIFLVHGRATLMQQCRTDGAMAVVFQNCESVKDRLQRNKNWKSSVDIAAINCPSQTTISGDDKVIEAIIAEFQGHGILAKKLTVTRAFHSAHMDPVLDIYGEMATRVRYLPLNVPVISNRDGELVEQFSAEYWKSHLRETVRFSDCVNTAIEAGANFIIEIGPKPALTSVVRELNQTLTVIPSLSEKESNWKSINEVVAHAFNKGMNIDWNKYFEGGQYRSVKLPNYPFQLASHWIQNNKENDMQLSNKLPVSSSVNDKASISGHFSKEITGVLAQLLKKPVVEIDVTRSFLEMGADSLVLVELVRQVNQKYGVDIVIHALFEDLNSVELLSNWLSTNLTNYPLLTVSGNESDDVFNSPTDPMNLFEKILGELKIKLASLLKVPSESVRDDRTFLEMGADSLILVEYTNGLNLEYGLNLSLHQLFEDLSTLNALAGFINENQRNFSSDSFKKEIENARVNTNVSVQTDKRSSLSAIVKGSEILESNSLNDNWRILMEKQVDSFNQLIQKQIDFLRIHSDITPSLLKQHNENLNTTSRGRQNEKSMVAELSKSAKSTVAQVSNSWKSNHSLKGKQNEHIENLVKLYQEKTKGSKKYAEEYRDVFSDYRTSLGFRPTTKNLLYPLVARSAQGSHIIDIDGNDYIDLTMAFGSSLLGYNPPIIKEALLSQIELGIQVGPKCPLSGQAAKLIAELTGVERVAFANSGTEAVMTAIRLARAVTGKTKILRFSGSYHGHSDTTLVKANRDSDYGLPIAPGVPNSVAQEVIVLDYAKEDSLAVIEKHLHELAAIIVEPIQSRRPGLHPREFLNKIRMMTENEDCALIFDEIITGFRLSQGGAQEYFGIKADLVTYGKVAGGGMPIGIIAGKRHYMDAIDGGKWNFGDNSYPQSVATFFAGTFSGHPLAMAASVAVLNYLKYQKGAVQRIANGKAARLGKELNEFFEKKAYPIHVDTAGSLFRFVFYNNFSVEFQPVEANILFYNMTLRGIYIWEGHTCFLSEAHSDEDVDAIIKAAKDSVSAMRSDGFFPSPEKEKTKTHIEGKEIESVELTNKSLNALSSSLIAESMRNMGLTFHEGNEFTLQSEITRLGIKRDKVKLFERLLHILAQAGILEYRKNIWSIIDIPANIASIEKIREEAESNNTRNIVKLLKRCAENLGDVLRGSKSAVDVLFSGDGYTLLEDLYAFAPGIARANEELAEKTFEIACQKNLREPVRILEIGAGTGVTTQYVLQRLNAHSNSSERPIKQSIPLQYTYTDISTAFFARAASKFSSYSDIEYKVLDIEKNPSEQGLGENSFDLIIASNVIHATKNIVRTLDHINSLLNANGTMVFLEGTEKQPWLDLIFGLTDGWWQFEDSELRSDYPLLRASQWQELLHKLNYIRVNVEPISSCHVIISAEKPISTKLVLDKNMVSPTKTMELVPLTSGQKEILVHMAVNEDIKPAYNESALFLLDGQLDYERLQNAFKQVVSRHDSLKAVLVDGKDAFRVSASTKIAIDFIDLSQITETLAQSKAKEWIKKQGRVEFELTQDPPLRANVIKLKEKCHWLYINAHHIVIDGLSYGTFIQELLHYYQFAANESILHSSKAVSLKEALDRQQNYTQEDKEYWVSQNITGIPNLELPTDRPFPTVQTFKSQRTCITLPTKLASDIDGACRQQGVTKFMLFLACYRLLLSRWCAQDSAIIGVPVSVHTERQGESFIGFGVNVLPIVGFVRASQAVEDYLKDTRQNFLTAFKHKSYPLSELIKESNNERDLSRPAIVTVLFNYEAISSIDSAGLVARPLVPPVEHSKYELTMDVVVDSNDVNIVLTYNDNLFMRHTIDNLLDRYQHLLQQIVSNPKLKLGNIDILLPKEKSSFGFNEEQEFSSECLHELFENQAKKTPLATAIRCGNKALTYEELRGRSNRLAHYLKNLGIKKGDRVAVCLPRTLDLVISLIAIMKCGAAYVPLDPKYPLERLETIIDSANACAIVVHSESENVVLRDNVKCVAIDLIGSILAELSNEFISTSVYPEDLAYIIFTSGSTGVPKGVAIEHRNAVSMIKWAEKEFNREQLQGTLASTSICFDLSIYEIFLPLSTGAKVIMVENVLYLSELDRQDDITLINTVPSAIDEIVKQGQVPSNVKVINLAGEALSKELVARIQQRYPEVQVYNLYGPSEDTTYSTFASIPKENQKPITIGRPIDGSQVYLLDEQLNPVVPGVKGTIYIAGNGVCRGYWNKPDTTAVAFLPNPFSRSGGDRMYNTGDLGRINSDNEIEYLGRSDHQIKVRGHRIELGEVESVMSSVPGIARAVVVAHGEIGKQKLHGFYTVMPNAVVSESDIRDGVRSVLPGYMVPSKMNRLDDLPLTQNGKIDRKAVLNMVLDPEQIKLPKDKKIPSNAMEEEIAEIWRTHLDLENLGVDENFFSLGGHSLMATQIVYAINKRYGCKLKLTDIMRNATVASLSVKVLEHIIGDSMEIKRFLGASIHGVGDSSLVN